VPLNITGNYSYSLAQTSGAQWNGTFWIGFGGTTKQGAPHSAVWIIDLEQKSAVATLPLAITAPIARHSASTVVASCWPALERASVMCALVYGGKTEAGFINELGRFAQPCMPTPCLHQRPQSPYMCRIVYNQSQPTWSIPVQRGFIPQPGRAYHAAAYDRVTGNMYVFGGETPAGVSSDMYILSVPGFDDATDSESDNLALSPNAFAWMSEPDPLYPGISAQAALTAVSYGQNGTGSYCCLLCFHRCHIHPFECRCGRMCQHWSNQYQLYSSPKC
jgi:hypothetical protein